MDGEAGAQSIRGGIRTLCRACPISRVSRGPENYDGGVRAVWVVVRDDARKYFGAVYFGDGARVSFQSAGHPSRYSNETRPHLEFASVRRALLWISCDAWVDFSAEPRGA